MNEQKNSQHFLKTPFGKACLIIILYAVIFFTMLGLIGANLDVVIYVIAAIFAVCGWRVLNMITPDIFLVMSWVGWLVFFVVKGVLSILIGMFVAPFVISKKIVSMIDSRT